MNQAAMSASKKYRSKKILIIGDSRTRNLDIDLNSMDPNFAFVCKCFTGANFIRVAKQTKEYILLNNSFSMIIILSGINDITQLVREPVKLVKIRNMCVAGTYNHLKLQIDEGMDILSASTQIPITICPIVGLDLHVYSPANNQAWYEQPIINQAVLAVNRYIYSVNVSHYIPTPLIESSIHKCKGKSGRMINHYAKLHDGCHPDPDTRALWASLIFKVPSKFLEL